MAAKKPSTKPAAKASKAPAQKAPSKAVKKPAAKKPATKVVAKKAPAKIVKKAPAPSKTAPKPATKAVAPKAPEKKTPAKKASAPVSGNDRVLAQKFVTKPLANKNLKLTPFLIKQRQRLLELKDSLLDSMRGVARDNLHSGTDTSAFGMHQADAGSDAYDRDFALSMLSKEQGSLYEIDEALKRIEDGTYGICDLCEKPIKHDRLEALPFTRYTVDCQAELEKRQHHNSARPQITSLFGLTEEEEETEEEESAENS
jgi:RNA polymerase-binding transcription factor DksA